MGRLHWGLHTEAVSDKEPKLSGSAHPNFRRLYKPDGFRRKPGYI